MKIKTQQLVEKVRRSPSDNGSFEVQGKLKSRRTLLAGDRSLLLFGCCHPSTSSSLYQSGQSLSGRAPERQGVCSMPWKASSGFGNVWQAAHALTGRCLPGCFPNSCSKGSTCIILLEVLMWHKALHCIHYQNELLDFAMEPKFPSASESSGWSIVQGWRSHCHCPRCAPLSLVKAFSFSGCPQHLSPKPEITKGWLQLLERTS